MATYSVKSNTYDGRYLKLTITQTQNIGANTSKLDWTLSSEGGNVNYYSIYPTTVKINGTEVYYKDTTTWTSYKFPAAKGSVSGSITVSHNNDGSLSVPVYFYTAVYASKYKKDYGGTFTLDKIPRQANLGAAPNFTDEDNPTITYSNPAGTAVSELVAAIYDTAGGTSYAGYRDVSKTGSTYTFTLSDAERDALRAAAKGNTLDVRFYLRTTIGGVNYYSSLQKTLTIKNGNPTLSPTVVDSNATTKALTGDANKLVRYFSNATYAINAAAVKKASLSSQKATHAGVAKTTATGTYNAVENGSFTFEAKDSRGNVTTKTITKTLIEYVKLTCNQAIDIDVNGKAIVDIKGNSFNGSFGATANTLTVQYRYRKSGGTYSNWTNATVTTSGNSYSATATITGLNYQEAYDFQCKAVDKLMTVETPEKVVKSLPVFDWGENDFHVHGDLIVEGSITGNNAASAMVLDDSADFVIESGNNGSYAYKKWSSGLMEAWRSAASTVSVTASSTSGALYYTNQVSLTTNGSASQFVSLENVQISVNKVSAVGYWMPVIARTNVSNGAASADVFFVNSVKDATAAVIPYVYFIGRWK